MAQLFLNDVIMTINDKKKLITIYDNDVDRIIVIYFGKWKLSMKQKYKLIWQVCNCKIKPHFNWLFADIIVLRIWLSCESNFDKKLMKRRNYQQLNHCNSHVHPQLLPDDVLLSVRHVQKWFIVTVLNLVVGWLNQLLNWAVLAFTN